MKDTIVIHHSASPPWTKAWDIRRWHRERGFNDIGYHIVIHQDGQVVPGRHIELEGAHCKGHNDTIGICIVGDNSSERSQNHWNAKQLAAAVCLLRVAREVNPDVQILGHCDLNPDTFCPGRTELEQLMGEL